MSGVQLPTGYRLERLRRDHPRKRFRSGADKVDDWLATKAWQNQQKHLSVTRVLLAAQAAIAGYYTLAIGQVDFSALPAAMAGHLPRRLLPVAILAWLGVRADLHGQGFGWLLLAQALCDCHEAGQTFAFGAVILDCLDDSAKAFYQRWDFEELPGHPYRLFLSVERLQAMISG